MAKLVKQDMQVRWAELGDNTKPLDSYIQNGWLAVKPPRQYFNWLDNRQDNMLAYINQAGIPEWDVETVYEGGFSYVQGSDNKVYKCLADSIGDDPIDQPANAAFWVVAFATKADFDAVEGRVDTLETQMTDGSGVTDPAAWRTALSVPTGLPTGMVMPFAGSAAPSGWLECAGQAVSRTGATAPLFAAIGVAFGGGDGTTTFNVPDLRGEFVRGWDNGRGVDTGRVLGSAQADSLKAHSHVLKYESLQLRSPSDYNRGGYTTTGTASGAANTESTGSTETRPRNVAMMYCIKT